MDKWLSGRFMAAVFFVGTLILLAVVTWQFAGRSDRPSDSSSENAAEASRFDRRALARNAAMMLNPIDEPTPLLIPGRRKPPVKSAGLVELPAESRVIGVSADGRYRAYLIDSLSVVSNHVVNDLIGSVPVTVTYCDLADCARVLTKHGMNKPLSIGIGGWNGSEMLIQVDGRFVPQKASGLTYDDHPFELSTWGDWKEAHPETDIFVGGDGGVAAD